MTYISKSEDSEEFSLSMGIPTFKTDESSKSVPVSGEFSDSDFVNII